MTQSFRHPSMARNVASVHTLFQMPPCSKRALILLKGIPHG